jgi:hypothetical protein
MWPTRLIDRLEALPMFGIGMLVTHACARIGLCALLAFAAGSRGEPEKSKWTLSIELSTRNGHAMAGLVRALQAERGHVTVRASHRTVQIAGPPSEIERLGRIIREVDDPDTAGRRIWTIRTRGVASNLASSLEELAERDPGWPPGMKIPKIIPDDVGHRVMVVADESGFLRVKRLQLESRRAPSIERGPIELPLGPRPRAPHPDPLPAARGEGNRLR